MNLRGKRKPGTKKITAAPNPHLAERFAEARRILWEGVAQGTPQRRRFKKLAEGVDAALAVMERFSRGELTVEQFQSELGKIRKRFPFLKPIPPPAWFPSDVAYMLLELVRAVKKSHPDAPHELVVWIRREFADPPWRPIDAAKTRRYHKAAQLRQDGWSWMRITRKLCALRSKEGHRCTKSCVDLIRMGVRPYQP